MLGKKLVSVITALVMTLVFVLPDAGLAVTVYGNDFGTYETEFIVCNNCGKPYEEKFDSNGFGKCTYCEFNVYEPAKNTGYTYYIENAGHLFWLADLINSDPSKYDNIDIILENDIVVNPCFTDKDEVNFYDNGELLEFIPIRSFKGVFDGKGHSIKGMYSNSSILFIRGNYGTVKNLKIYNSQMFSTAYVGLFCDNYGTIEKCEYKGKADSEIAGSIICMDNYGIIRDCSVNANLICNGLAGGICRFNHGGEIIGCSYYGFLKGKSGVGGICVESNHGVIANCLVDAKLLLASSGCGGGICGAINEATIVNCCFANELLSVIDFGGHIGGIFGASNDPLKVNIQNCIYGYFASSYDLPLAFSYDKGNYQKLISESSLKKGSDFESGDVCYCLSQGTMVKCKKYLYGSIVETYEYIDGSVWRQKIGTDAIPYLCHDSNREDIVYKNEISGNVVYSNIPLCNGKDGHNFNTNGVCLDCGFIDDSLIPTVTTVTEPSVMNPVTTSEVTTTSVVTTTQQSVEVTTHEPAVTTSVTSTVTDVPVTTAVSSNSENKKTFEFGKDNWNFDNTSEFFKGDTYRDQISSEYLEKLKKSINPGEYQAIFKGNGNTLAELDKNWEGTCYGMAATELLSYNDRLDELLRANRAENLYHMPDPVESSDVKSLLTYYQMLQFRDNMIEKYSVTVSKSHRENILAIQNAIDKYGAALVGYSKQGFGTHVVLAYAYDNYTYTQDGEPFDGRIKVCDPQSSSAGNMYYDINYNTQNYYWKIKKYENERVDSNSAVFIYIEGDPDIVEGKEIENNSIRIDMESNNGSVISGNEDKDGNFIMHGVPKLKAVDLTPAYGVETNRQTTSSQTFIQENDSSSFKIAQNVSDKLEGTVRYPSSRMTAFSSAGKEIFVEADGRISLRGKSFDEVNNTETKYMVEMTLDKDQPMRWFNLSVSGQGASEVELEKTNGGYLLTSDNLSQTSLSANNKDDTVDLTFSTEKTAVYIFENEEGKLSVSIDEDGDGIFEKVIAESINAELFITGDVNGDGNVNGVDCVLVKKYLLGGLIVSSSEIMDVNKDGEVNSADLVAIVNLILIR